ncbi:MAG: hypothetical protein F2534_12880 [Actinobacteria bacterium]|nr:hypothetical protein [Actinomycetota bacterium]
MAGAQRTMTIRFVGDMKDMRRGVKDLVSQLDDTESAGKRVATAMRQLAGDAERDFADARDAADRLARALGDDTVAEIQAAGRSVDGYIQDLRRMGLSYDDVRADVEELADSIRRVETTRSSIEGLKSPLKDVDRGLQDVRSSADQSRSVMANLVGNSAQDLGELGGVAGTAGVAIGQLAEYAVDGNIALKNLVAFAGPMLLLGGGIALVTKNMAKNRAQAQANSEQVSLFAEALADGASAAESFRTALGGSGDQMPKLELFIGDEVRDMVPVLARAGITYEEFVRKVRTLDATFGSGDPAFSQWVASMVGPGEDMNLLLRFGNQLATNYGDGLSYAQQQALVFTETQASQNMVLLEGEQQFGSITGALLKAGEATDSIYEKTERYAKAQQRAREAAQKRLEKERELYGFLLGQIDAQRAYEVAVDSGEDAIFSFNEVLGASSSTLEEIDDAARSSADTLIQQAEAFAASKGAADGSKESISLQIEELYRLATSLDPNSPLRARLVGYIGELQSIPPTVDTMLRLSISAGAVVTRDGDQIGILARPGQAPTARAAGGPVRAGELYAVGDNPDGSWNRTTELFVPSTSGTILSASDSRAALAGMGGATVINHYHSWTVQVPPTVDKAAVGREIQEAMRAADRTYGPVYATARG